MEIRLNLMNFSTTFDERRLLVTDLDGTLIGGSKQELKKLQQALAQERESIVLVYVSGQNLAEQVAAIEAHQLSQPDYIISAVGTEIHRFPGEYPLDEWYRYIQAAFNRQEISDFLAEHTLPLVLQPEEHQTPLKISYFWEEATPADLDALHIPLLEAGLPAKLVYSSRVYLDIIPERAGNGPAVKFLVDSLVLSHNQVFVCGDSGNDVDLFQYGFRGIVVCNATPGLKKAVKLRAYFSHKPHAAGLLEGLRHYKVLGSATKPARRTLAREAFERGCDSLRRNITPMGFSAAGLTDNPLTDEDSNYFAVWSRDGIKAGLWSLTLNDPDVTACFRRTLQLMADHQTKSGQIPANVQIKDQRPEYSGVGDISSIDSVLWFVIGCCRYAAYTGERDFLDAIYPKITQSMRWLRAHDSNNCGLIEIPESSDWMDLFPRSYNVLYDEVLW